MADSTARTWAPVLHPAVMVAAACTVRVERARPANDSPQKGTTWPASERRPQNDQTHRRFSSNDGTVPMAVAARLAAMAGVAKTPTRTPRTVRLVAVEIAETPVYRASFRIARRWPVVKRGTDPRVDRAPVEHPSRTPTPPVTVAAAPVHGR